MRPPPRHTPARACLDINQPPLHLASDVLLSLTLAVAILEAYDADKHSLVLQPSIAGEEEVKFAEMV
jgi:hypothetical protein